MEQRQKEKKSIPFRKAMHVLEAGKRLTRRMLLSKEKRDELNNALIDAAYNGENKKVMRLLKAGVDITVKDSYGWTVLHWAALNGQTQICALLMEKYAELGGDVMNLITTNGRKGETALRLAAEKGHTETCSLLIAELLKAMFGNKTADAFMNSFSACASQ